MQLTITLNTAIADIQKEFQQYFPYLTIEFFNKLHQTGEPSKRENIYPHTKTIKEISTTQNEGVLKLSKEMTVAELEKELEVKFGLHAQVFRKHHLDWIETTSTDTWALEKQNNIAREYK